VIIVIDLYPIILSTLSSTYELYKDKILNRFNIPTYKH